MSDKTILLLGLIAFVIMAAALFIVWRLQKLKAQQAEAEQRAMVAFEEMNKLTKDLRDRGKQTPADPSLTPGQRLQQMYPGPKRQGGAPQGS
ncbi:MAG TPA: hypothetical protein VMT93_05160 [Gemmatimonadaceae bacterium]|nr:hypothetical protein [Gemmatimonadaceae bacterium]